ncbi:MAG: hypothetical protein BWY59_02369 [Verrucomicrobia bacterium ADurb.Bin345]|nr:MAG: hypothetical protein BWY59_02369 [Verrucomicrobia bacterium ADurb.Bin345]
MPTPFTPRASSVFQLFSTKSRACGKALAASWIVSSQSGGSNGLSRGVVSFDMRGFRLDHCFGGA